jgi:hypothetical protein
VGHVAQMGLLVEKPGGKRSLGRPRWRWVDTIKMDLIETELSGVDWTSMAQNRDKWKTFVNVVLNCQNL